MVVVIVVVVVVVIVVIVVVVVAAWSKSPKSRGGIFYSFLAPAHISDVHCRRRGSSAAPNASVELVKC